MSSNTVDFGVFSDQSMLAKSIFNFISVFERIRSRGDSKNSVAIGIILFFKRVVFSSL